MKQEYGNKKKISKKKCTIDINQKKNDVKNEPVCTWCGKFSKELCCSYECYSAFELIMG